ncbi:hypothetical protein H8959_006722 [Pygathrix nigripes]
MRAAVGPRRLAVRTDLEDLCYKYSRNREIELKYRHGLVPFAFGRFEDPGDAQDVIYGRNGLPPSGSWQDLKDHMREARMSVTLMCRRMEWGWLSIPENKTWNMPCVNWMTPNSALMRVKLPTSEFILKEAPAMATHGLCLVQGAVTLHTKAGAPHTTLLSGSTETGDGNFLFFRLTELLCDQNLHSRLRI